jgi:hypothetical protein
MSPLAWGTGRMRCTTLREFWRRYVGSIMFDPLRQTPARVTFGSMEC